MAVFLEANWQNIIMANYAVPQEILIPYLPKGTDLDLYNGEAYVSLVGFMFKNTKLFQLPVPFLGNFEEVNLRFYVARKINNELRRGVVFIDETVPYKSVAWLANKLYKEHYRAIPTKHKWEITSSTKKLDYHWLVNKKWNSIEVEALNEPETMVKGSFEEFIFEHYYGYTKVNSLSTLEYKIDHPRWKINKMITSTIKCDFAANYGGDFGFIMNRSPTSVFIAEGSAVKVDWKRNKI